MTVDRAASALFLRTAPQFAAHRRKILCFDITFPLAHQKLGYIAQLPDIAAPGSMKQNIRAASLSSIFPVHSPNERIKDEENIFPSFPEEAGQKPAIR